MKIQQDDDAVAIVEQLLSIEVKLETGQSRAKQKQDINIDKARHFNMKVDELRDEENAMGIKAMQEARDLENLNKAMKKAHKLEEFKKLKNEVHQAVVADKQ